MEVHAQQDSALEPPREPARVPSLVVRLGQVFYAPAHLFERLAERPAWSGALLLGGALVSASFLLVPAEIWELSFRRQLLASGRPIPEGLALGGVTRMLGLVGGVLFWFVLAFFLAGVITAVFHLFLGDRGRYVQYLSVTAHGLLIPAVGGLLIVPLRIVQQDPQLTLNLALFMPGEATSYGLRVLRMLDLFMLWSYLVVAVGVSRVDTRRSWGSAAAFLLVLSLGMAMVFAVFAPAA